MALYVSVIKSAISIARVKINWHLSVSRLSGCTALSPVFTPIRPYSHRTPVSLQVKFRISIGLLLTVPSNSLLYHNATYHPNPNPFRCLGDSWYINYCISDFLPLTEELHSTLCIVLRALGLILCFTSRCVSFTTTIPEGIRHVWVFPTQLIYSYTTLHIQ